MAKVTAYGFNDNDPPSAEIAYPKSDGFPSLHNVATEGKGTYADPVTVASSKDELPIGSFIYVPYLQKYFIMEDYCAQCISDWAGGMWHFDIWMGPNQGSQSWSQLGPCEDYVTRMNVEVILDPAQDLPVDETPLFDGQSCTAKIHNEDRGMKSMQDPVGACHDAAKAFCNQHGFCKTCQAWGSWGNMFFAAVCNDDPNTCHQGDEIKDFVAGNVSCTCQQAGGCTVGGATCANQLQHAVV